MLIFSANSIPSSICSLSCTQAPWEAFIRKTVSFFFFFFSQKQHIELDLLLQYEKEISPHTHTFCLQIFPKYRSTFWGRCELLLFSRPSSSRLLMGAKKESHSWAKTKLWDVWREQNLPLGPCQRLLPWLRGLDLKPRHHWSASPSGRLVGRGWFMLSYRFESSPYHEIFRSRVANQDRR